MSLVFRMLWVWLLSLRRERLPIGVAESRLRLATLPNDLDINMHMNNGRYLTIADLSRVDLFLRTGLARVMWRERWMPIITEHTMSYKRSLRLFQRYDAVMNLTHWDDRCFYMTHRFLVGDRVVAEGRSTGLIRSRDRLIPPEEVLDCLRAFRLAHGMGSDKAGATSGK